MAALGSQSIASSYEQLLHVDRDGGGNSTTLVDIKDGDNGTTFALQLATDKVQANGTLTVGADGSGYDVVFNSATAGDNFTWDSSEEKLIITGTSGAVALDIHTGKATFGDAGTTHCTINQNTLMFRSATGDIGTETAHDVRFKVNSTTRFVLDANSRISLSNNDSNTGNTVFGYSAFNTSSDNSSDSNTVIGHLAMGTGAVAGANFNTAIGFNALTDITSGDENVAIGVNSGDSITTSSSNTLVGVGTGRGITTSDTKATAVGYLSLNALTSGQNNVGIGYQSMSETTQGNYNTAIGYQAMYRDAGLANTHNTFVGQGIASGDWTTTASTSNTGVGSGVMQGAMNDADNNSALGADSLNALVSGKNNVAIGHLSLAVNQSGSYNTAVGATSLDACTGGQNAAFGWASGGAVIGGTNNVLLGTNAGNNITTGNQNTCVGDTAITSAVGGANQTVIGYGVTGQGDNTVTLGNASVTDLYLAMNSGARFTVGTGGAVTMPNQPAFQVKPSSNQTNLAIGTVDVVFGTEIFDQGGDFSSNTFTAPMTGKYQLNLNLYLTQIDSAVDYYQVTIVTSNRTYYGCLDPDFGQDNGYFPITLAVLADMDINDTAKIQFETSGGSATADVNNSTIFSGYLVC